MPSPNCPSGRFPGIGKIIFRNFLALGCWTGEIREEPAIQASQAVNEGPITNPGNVPRTAATPAAAPTPSQDVVTRNSTQPFAPPQATPISDRSAPELAVGTLVGKYRIVEAVRGGGMGFVYRAFNPVLKCDVALKVIRAGVYAQPEAVRRFALECEALARFRHPHIVAVHDADEYEGRPYLVMEYLSGGSLAQHGARFQREPRAAVALIEKVARAVQQLHAEGMLHRDLKPANVLLDASDEPRISDFGLIKLLESDDELTRTGNRPGTPPYMAPEQTELIKAPLGPPTDVWALGVMLYELLLGRRPFANADRATLFHQIATPRSPIARPGAAAGLRRPAGGGAAQVPAQGSGPALRHRGRVGGRTGPVATRRAHTDAASRAGCIAWSARCGAGRCATLPRHWCC